MVRETSGGRDESDLRPSHVVGIGASAGGLESLELLFANVPPDLGIAYVVIQHLSANHRSMMPELLGRVTGMPVVVGVDGSPIRRDTITLIPPGHYLTLVDDRVHLEPKPPQPALTLPIDRFFESLATEWNDTAACIVLSGTGTDGTRGAERIHAGGGLVMAEDPATARFDGMPRSAIDAGVVDLVLSADELGRHLVHLASGDEVVRGDAPRAPEADAFHKIVELLHADTGVDFRRYKPATVGRRVTRRMMLNKVTDAEDYVRLLAVDDAERQQLYRELLIRVTSFFRDAEVWEALAERAIAPIVAAADSHDTLRMWVPGCSTGEEAYTLAMLVLDEIDRQGRPLDLKVFATDLDREGLDIAARGRYTISQMAAVGDERIDRYFSRAEGTATVSTQLRKSVIFAHHNVTRDAPFTRLDLVSCRNLLIYLSTDLQNRVISAFHFALRPGGTLLLGSSESLGDQSERYGVVDHHARIFRSTGQRRATAWVGEVREVPIPALEERLYRHPARKPQLSLDQALATVAAQYAPPGVLCDTEGGVRHIFGDVSPFLRLAPGAAALSITEMARPELSAAIAAATGRALRSGQPSSFPAVIPHEGPNGHGVDGVVVRVMPVRDHDAGEPSGAVVTFERSDQAIAEVPPPFDPVRVELEELHEELRRARRSQQRLVEQLETSNEELQATNEEMVAANEELQATNEELQSVNEELFTVNAENARRIQELEVLRHDLDHLLAATDVGALVVDRGRVIRRFTPSVSEFLPILERDVGRPIGHLANSLGGADFLDEMARVIDTGETRERSIDTVHGPVLVRMIPYRMRDMDGALITFVDVSTVKRNFELSRRVLDALPAHVAFLDRAGNITMVNAAWEQFAADNDGDPARTGPGTNYLAVCSGWPEAAPVAAGIESVLSGRSPYYSYVYPCPPADGSERWFLLQCTPAGPDEAVVVHFDITAQKQAERMLIGLATHDPLTGVLNRRGIETELETVLRRSRRTGRDACALMLDCDDFKRVNDRVGHAGGDGVLRTVARRIERTLRAGDTLARIGGDEFLVLMPEASLDAAHAAAERVRLSVSSDPVAVSHEDISLTVSVAVVYLDAHVYTLEHLIDRSRDGLRSSKEHGKNRVTPGAAREPGSGRRAEVVDLLQEGHLGTAAQPIVATTSGEVVGVELLVRSLVVPALPPLTIFRLAAEEGMLSVLDEHALKRALATAGTAHQPGTRHVNLYPSTLLAMSPAQIDDTFAGTSHASHPLVVELSEQQMLGDPAELLPNIARLRSHGVQIALDDVGFGRTSLETLVIVEPQIVKIDAICIHGVDGNDARRKWLRRLVGVAGSLGARVVAEGVETYAELKVVDGLGIDWCQGYYFGRPELVGPG